MKTLDEKPQITFKDPEGLVQEILFKDKGFDLIKEGKILAKSYSDALGIAEQYSTAQYSMAQTKEISTSTFESSNESLISKTLYSIDSQTKIFTASAILRMMEEEKYQTCFPNGIDTKLSELIKYLKEFYPESKFIREELEKDPNYSKITIKDLALHTSGLVATNKDYFPDFMTHKPNQKLSHSQMLDAEKTARSARFGENYGEYFYNNIDYELLGAILVAVVNNASGKSYQGEDKYSYTQIINQLVIDRVKDKLKEAGLQTQTQNLKFFTSEEMQIIDGKTSVATQPDLEAVSTKHFHGQEFLPMPSHIYDLASGGAYSNAESQAILAFYILHDQPRFSIFKTSKILEIFNKTQTTQYDEKGNPTPKTYGFGYESYQDPNWQHIRTHGGGGYGSNSRIMVDNKNNKSAVALVAFEDLTLPLAFALTKGSCDKYREMKITQIPTQELKLDIQIYYKSQELKQKLTEEQILQMRNGLEKAENIGSFLKEFTKEFPELSTPSPNPSMATISLGQPSKSR